MARNSRLIRDADATEVFDVLRDGAAYAEWVVGTRMIRAVDPGWPEPGTRLHYTVGRWPLRMDDVTRSVHYEEDRRLHLEAQVWPAGAARIVLSAEPVEGGVVVTIDESPDRGLLKLVNNPGLELTVKIRNVETLRRFERQVRRQQRARLPRVPE